MKKFAFRLQRVMDLRVAQEKVKLGQLGSEQQRLNQEIHKLDVFRGEQELQIREVQCERMEPFSVWAQTQNCRYLGRISRVIDFQHGRVQAQERSVESARLKYVEARKDTRVLEILREKKWDEWKLDRLREENKILDEVGSRKAREE
jgi:flagellar FliJ protein